MRATINKSDFPTIKQLQFRITVCIVACNILRLLPIRKERKESIADWLVDRLIMSVK